MGAGVATISCGFAFDWFLFRLLIATPFLGDRFTA
jgi:hypothetical protein